MKLLMITRKIDSKDGLAGFTYNWVKKLAQNLDKLYVICLEKGDASGLPENIEIYSLGKENGKNRFKEFFNFFKFAIKLVPKVDGVFTHQNPEYGILIAPWCKIFGKRLIAWYVHKRVGLKLKILNFLVDNIVSVSKESFRLKSKKLILLHHGIDTDLFSWTNKQEHEELRLLSISRISATKQINKILGLVAELKEKIDKKIILKIVGEPSLPEDMRYLAELKKQVENLDLINSVEFLGSKSNNETPSLYQWADIFLNFSNTGSIDKTVLEAMSCGTLVLVSNEAFAPIFKELNIDCYLAELKNAKDLVIKLLNNRSVELNERLRKYVVNNHDLNQLAKQIVGLY